MKKFAAFLCPPVVLFLAVSISMAQDITGEIVASASVVPITTLDIVTESGDKSLSFGTLTTLYQKAPEYIQVTAVSNYGLWKVDIYTENFPGSDPSVDEWGYRYGGLKSGDALLPLGWAAFNGPEWGVMESTGNPAFENRWKFLKDKKDVDDPATPDIDESWDAMRSTDYTVAAFGGPGYGFVYNPNIPDTGVEPIYGPFFVFLETAGPAQIGSYSSSIYFDLYHE